jgi:hypothetical protein
VYKKVKNQQQKNTSYILLIKNGKINKLIKNAYELFNLEKTRINRVSILTLFFSISASGSKTTSPTVNFALKSAKRIQL